MVKKKKIKKTIIAIRKKAAKFSKVVGSLKLPRLRKRTKRKVVVRKIIVKVKTKPIGDILRERIARRKASGI